MTQTSMNTENNSKLLKGIIIGGVLGGIVSMLDSSTRTQVKEKAITLKDSSKEMINQVRENPGEVKEQMLLQFQVAADTLKDAINDAKSLYERVNNDVFGKVNKVMDISSETLTTAKEAKGELKDIGSKVMEAGSELKETVNVTGTGTGSSASSTSSTGSMSGAATSASPSTYNESPVNGTSAADAATYTNPFSSVGDTSESGTSTTNKTNH